jgi:hypothetical protein
MRDDGGGVFMPLLRKKTAFGGIQKDIGSFVPLEMPDVRKGSGRIKTRAPLYRRRLSEAGRNINAISDTIY